MPFCLDCCCWSHTFPTLSQTLDYGLDCCDSPTFIALCLVEWCLYCDFGVAIYWCICTCPTCLALSRCAAFAPHMPLGTSHFVLPPFWIVGSLDSCFSWIMICTLRLLLHSYLDYMPALFQCCRCRTLPVPCWNVRFFMPIPYRWLFTFIPATNCWVPLLRVRIDIWFAMVRLRITRYLRLTRLYHCN